MDQVLIIIPTYNEAGNIKTLIRGIRSALPNAKVVFVDDNSPDGTAGIIRSCQGHDAFIDLLSRPCKQGLASAYKAGFDYACRSDCSVIVQMDADLSHDPAVLPRMIARLDSCDMVCGSRYVPGGGVSDWPLSRIALSRSANIFCQHILGIPFHDATSGYKCFRREVLSQIDYRSIPCEGYAFQIEMLYRAVSAGLCVQEMPIVFRARENDHSKISHGIVWEAFCRVCALAGARGAQKKCRHKRRQA